MRRRLCKRTCIITRNVRVWFICAAGFVHQRVFTLAVQLFMLFIMHVGSFSSLIWIFTATTEQEKFVVFVFLKPCILMWPLHWFCNSRMIANLVPSLGNLLQLLFVFVDLFALRFYRWPCEAKKSAWLRAVWVSLTRSTGLHELGLSRASMANVETPPPSGFERKCDVTSGFPVQARSQCTVYSCNISAQGSDRVTFKCPRH